MNFFEKQERAKKHTTLLILVFALAVLLILALVNLTFTFFYVTQISTQTSIKTALFSKVSVVTSTVVLTAIVLATLFRIYKLQNGGGAGVARSLRGREITHETKDFKEKQFLNIVEEMSIASGAPIPQVFVLDKETSINAFAAGHDIQDSVVAVTKGTLYKLNREELQGVVAHEFSHIFNGDMKMNIRLTGVIFGLIFLTLIGRLILRGSARSSFRGSYGRRRRGGGQNMLPFVGLALIVLGFIGVFFGNLIRAMISRQREILADSSAVQYTRNPQGILNALKKIWVHPNHALIQNTNSDEFSHFFFGQSFTSSFFSFSSHPPIEERIKSIQPNFDIKAFKNTEWKKLEEDLKKIDESKEEERKEKEFSARSNEMFDSLSSEDKLWQMASVLAASESVGQASKEQLDKAHEIVQTLPEFIKDEPYETLLAFFLHENSENEEGLKIQLNTLGDKRKRVVELKHKLTDLPYEHRLPALEVLLKELKDKKDLEVKSLLDILIDLIEADGESTPEEFVMFTICKFSLEKKKEPWRPSNNKNKFRDDIHTLLSFLTYMAVSQESEEEIDEVFKKGWKHIFYNNLKALKKEDMTLEKVESSLEHLFNSGPKVKRAFLSAMQEVIFVDKKVTVRERETFRAVSLALNFPMPLFISDKV